MAVDNIALEPVARTDSQLEAVDTRSLPGVVDRRIRLGVLDSKSQGVEGRILEPLGSPEQLDSIELVDSIEKVGKKSWSTEA